MIRALFTAATGMQAQQINLDTVANNLANVNTTGFKRNRVDFQDLLYQTLRAPGTRVTAGAEVPTGIQVGHGTRPVATQKIWTQGNFQQTENPLDLVIEGDGFFQLARPDGTIAYTRAGTFKRDSQGQIVNSDGLVLQPALTLPADTTSVTVGADGTVSVTSSSSTTPTQLGQIELARFMNPAGLNAIGKNLFLVTQASGQATTGVPGLTGLGTVGQGMLESSNVSVVEEMVNMIAAQRAFEANSKAIKSADEMLSISNNVQR
ncbi:MAG: flagellar basal-body rod protein FlgG [Candidatus Rokubacteria bacterium]|nr:flagellar basal-body rod protein FlgG [Candidatus Rokubacteria bacterium]